MYFLILTVEGKGVYCQSLQYFITKLHNVTKFSYDALFDGANEMS
jgi:hypothetical protein